MPTTATRHPPPHRVGVENHRSADADTQAGSLRGWDQRYDQIGAGPFAGATLDVQLDELQLFRELNSQALRQQGRAPSGTFLFALNAEESAQSRFRGSLVTRDSVLCVDEGTEFDFCSPAQYLACGVTVPVQALQRHAAATGVEFSDGAPIQHDVIHAAAAVARLRLFLAAAFDTLQLQPGVLQQANARSDLGAQVMDHVLDVVRGAEPDAADQRTARRHARIVARAEDYVLARPFETVTVADLCRDVGASRRLLQYAFLAVMDMPPNRYLRAIRLCRVRRELKAGLAPVNIQDTAARWGFWHLGHFATDYKRMFGERPSDTLRDATGR